MDGPGCRMREFVRWDKTMLKHEREFLSKELASAGAFLDDDTKEGILHDITDLDYCLAEFAHADKTPE